MSVDNLVSRAIQELQRQGLSRDAAVDRVLRMTKGEQLGLFGGGERHVPVKAHTRRTKGGKVVPVVQHQSTRKTAGPKAGLHDRMQEEQDKIDPSAAVVSVEAQNRGTEAWNVAQREKASSERAKARPAADPRQAKVAEILRLVDQFDPMDAIPSLVDVLRTDGLQDWMGDDLDDLLKHARATVANVKRQQGVARSHRPGIDADVVQVVAPLDHNVHDGYRIDGSQVPMWARKADATKAVKALGWQVSDLTRVHTRFQSGWSIYAHGAGPDGQGGLVSSKWARKRLGELGYQGPMGTMRGAVEAAQLGDPVAARMLDDNPGLDPGRTAAFLKGTISDVQKRIAYVGIMPNPNDVAFLTAAQVREGQRTRPRKGVLRSLANRIAELSARQDLAKSARLLIHVPTLRESGALPLEKAWLGDVVEWVVEAATCRFRKADTGVGVLTVTGVSALPYHVIVKTAAEARARAIEVVDALKQGRSPSRGVYRLDVA